MLDDLLSFQTTAGTNETKTAGTSASWQHGAAVDFKTTPGTMPRGFKAHFYPLNVSATASATLTATIQESANSSTWNKCYETEITVAATADVKTTLPVDMPFVLTKRYARLLLTPSNTTSGLVLTSFTGIDEASPG